jgi:hypothetical protein
MILFLGEAYTIIRYGTKVLGGDVSQRLKAKWILLRNYSSLPPMISHPSSFLIRPVKILELELQDLSGP